MASSRPTRWSRFTSTWTWKAIGRSKGKLDTRRQRDRGPHLQPEGLRPHLVLDERTKLVAQEGHRVPEGERRPLPEDHRLLRRSRTRRAHAAGAGQRERRPRRRRTSRYVMRITGDDDEGKAPARQLHRPGSEVSRHRHHLAAAVHRRRCPDLPPDRARPRSRLDDRVQADRRPRHARPRGHKKYYFTLIDFRKATNHFADPDFDGEPVQIYEPGEDDPIAPPDDVPPIGDGEDAFRRRRATTKPSSSIPSRDIDDAAGDDGGPRKFYVDGVRGLRRRRARRVSRRERQARHRDPARLSRRRRCGSASPASTTS